MSDTATTDKPIPVGNPNQDEVFSTIGVYALARMYWGIIFTQLFVLLLTFGAFFFTVTLGILQFGLSTTFGFQPPANQIAANTLEIAFYLGWFVMLVQFPYADGKCKPISSRRLLQICLVILTLAAVVDYLPIFGNLRPALAQFLLIIQIITVLPSLAIYPLQLLYLRQLASVVNDQKVELQTRVWIWLTPSVLAVSIMLTFVVHQIFLVLLAISLLTVVIQYWNMLDRLRRALKRLMVSTDEYGPACTR